MSSKNKEDEILKIQLNKEQETYINGNNYGLFHDKNNQNMIDLNDTKIMDVNDMFYISNIANNKPTAINTDLILLKSESLNQRQDFNEDKKFKITDDNYYLEADKFKSIDNTINNILFSDILNKNLHDIPNKNKLQETCQFQKAKKNLMINKIKTNREDTALFNKNYDNVSLSIKNLILNKIPELENEDNFSTEKNSPLKRSIKIFDFEKKEDIQKNEIGYDLNNRQYTTDYDHIENLEAHINDEKSQNLEVNINVDKNNKALDEKNIIINKNNIENKGSTYKFVVNPLGMDEILSPIKSKMPLNHLYLNIPDKNIENNPSQNTSINNECFSENLEASNLNINPIDVSLLVSPDIRNIFNEREKNFHEKIIKMDKNNLMFKKTSNIKNHQKLLKDNNEYHFDAHQDEKSNFQQKKTSNTSNKILDKFRDAISGRCNGKNNKNSSKSIRTLINKDGGLDFKKRVCLLYSTFSIIFISDKFNITIVLI